jgi:hypothetical protein
MSYPGRGQGTTQSADERREEAWQILYKHDLANLTQAMSEREAGFVDDLCTAFERYGDRTIISVKQLWWLRNLLERYQ